MLLAVLKVRERKSGSILLECWKPLKTSVYFFLNVCKASFGEIFFFGEFFNPSYCSVLFSIKPNKRINSFTCHIWLIHFNIFQNPYFLKIAMKMGIKFLLNKNENMISLWSSLYMKERIASWRACLLLRTLIIEIILIKKFMLDFNIFTHFYLL